MGDASAFLPSNQLDVDENEAPREFDVSFSLKLVKSERGMRGAESGLWLHYVIPWLENTSGDKARVVAFMADTDFEPGPRSIQLREIVEAAFTVMLGEALDVVGLMEPSDTSVG